VPLWETLLTAAKIWATKRWWERERERRRTEVVKKTGVTLERDGSR